MAAFSSNIDITSGGTYAMDVTNGETSSKVATDLNGKFANIQELLQNGLPEVWTGDSLPDSLPNGKIIEYNNNLYQSNLLKILTVNDYNNIIDNSVKIEIGSYIGAGTYGIDSPCEINTSFEVKILIVVATDPRPYCMIAFNNHSVVISSDLNLQQTNITFHENKVTWYNTSSYTGRDAQTVQLNISGHMYTFIAIG